MSLGGYVGGLLLFAAMLGSVLAGSAVIVRRRLPHLEGATRLVAGGVVATAGLLAVHLVPGMLGVLSRGSVLVGSGLWLVLAIVVPAVAETPRPASPARPREEKDATTL